MAKRQHKSKTHRRCAVNDKTAITHLRVDNPFDQLFRVIVDDQEVYFGPDQAVVERWKQYWRHRVSYADIVRAEARLRLEQ
jgi:hypothetical protein